MDITRLQIGEEPPHPQPRSFWLVRLLITCFFAGGAAAAEVIDFPINSELTKLFHFSDSSAQPDKPPGIIAPNQLEDAARPGGNSSANELPQAMRFVIAPPSLESRFDPIALNDEDDNAKPDAHHWGIIVVGLLCSALGLIFRRKILAVLQAGERRAIANRAVRELRRERRRPTRFRTGKLFDVEGRFLMECAICDRSEHGARIKIGQTLKICHSLHLRDEVDQITVQASVAWRRGNELGLTF